MAKPGFDLEQVRLAAARHLPVACHDDFLRLTRTLAHGPVFQWLLIDAPDEALRKKVMAALDEVLHAAGLTSNRLPLSDKIGDVAELEARLVKNAKQASVVHVLGRRGWFDAARWDAFNARRERLASEARARLVFWLDADAIALASRGAPDLWAWRGGVYAFLPEVTALVGQQVTANSAPDGYEALLNARPKGIDNRSMAERSRRVAEIRTWLAQHPSVPDELLVTPLDELGCLLYELGDHDEALQHWRDVELPLHERLGDERARAVTMGQIAGILQDRGQLDEALRLRREEALATYIRLGDVHAQAITQGKIADILQARGQLDEAMRIRTEQELPVHESLGDLRERAITLGKIADILQARGKLDEAMRIRTVEELPVYQQLGDLHAAAVTMGKVADILQTRGQLDEALRIRHESQLPVYERMGDVRGKAVVMGRIADILQARGLLDEALRIRREEQLPVFVRLGEVRAQAVIQRKIAELLQALGRPEEAQQIRRESCLPVFQALGDVRERAVTQSQMGLHLLDSGGPADAQEAQQMLRVAWCDLARLGLPEADELAKAMQAHGLSLPAGDLKP